MSKIKERENQRNLPCLKPCELHCYSDPVQGIAFGDTRNRNLTNLYLISNLDRPLQI